MELDILKLVYDYSIQKKLVDLNFIDKLIDIVVSKKKLNNYVKKIATTNELEKYGEKITCASYNFLTKELSVYYKAIQLCIEKANHYDQLFNSLEQIMFRNLQVTQYILHELEHAFQNKQLNDKHDNSIEAKIISASLMAEQILKNPKIFIGILMGKIKVDDVINNILKHKEKYLQYYHLNPTERLAQVNSFITIVNSLNSIKQFVPNLYAINHAYLHDNMIKGYTGSWREFTCPTEEYLLSVGQSNVWNDFDFYNEDSSKLVENASRKYGLYRRLSLGLPVKHSEYNSIKYH